MKALQKKKAWPTKAAMQQIYRKQLWGTNGTTFYSGSGSHDSNLVAPYIASVTSFLASLEEKIVVCDLGCGDFNIGSRLVPFAKNYIAVDIVEELIDHNRTAFQSPHLQFQCLDIAKDELPMGDCAIVRQVLQHLSNAEIKAIVSKLYCYKYLIITEHVPKGAFVPNLDIISGQGIRLKKQSGVDLLSPPFNVKAKETRHLVSLVPPEGNGLIHTMLYIL